MIARLREEEWPVLYFFYRHTIAANHQAGAAVRDWLAQVLKFSPPLQSELKEEIQKMREKESGVEALPLADLFGLLCTALSHLPKAYILVDALDEMNQETLEPFLHQLSELGEWRPLEVKLVMTSRPVAVVERTVRGLNVLDVRLDRQRVESDIAAYVQYRLADSSIPPESRPRAAETVMQRCDGLFLYARLAMDHLLERPNWDLDDLLEAIPTGLSVVYAKILNEQRNRSDLPAGMQQFILECVSHATRPLRLLEIADLINVSEGLNDLGTTKNLTRLACGPLLEVLPDETVHVVHHSLTEYLSGTSRDAASQTPTDYPIFETGATHNSMALRCIAYLRGGCLESVELRPAYFGYKDRMPEKKILPPFTRYAAANWFVHAGKAALAGHDQSELNKRIRELFNNEDVEKLGILGRADGKCGLTPLGLATSFNLTGVAKKCLELEKLKPEESQGNKEAALRHAAAHGYADLVVLLLAHGADVRSYSENGNSALHAAVYKNRHEAIRALLDGGADPFLPLGTNETVMDHDSGPKPEYCPAYFAFARGDLETVSLFMPYLETKKKANWVLGIAIRERRQNIMELLMQHPLIDVNAKIHFFTPLYTACLKRDPDLIEMLLRAGADPNILHEWSSCEEKPKDGYNAVHAVSGIGEATMSGVATRTSDEAVVRRCFKLVLDAGGAVNHVDIKGKTPLHIASDVIAVQCLLDAGVDPNVRDRAGETLLHTTYNSDIIRLIASRVDIDAKADYRGVTPLLSALTEMYGDDRKKFAKASLLLDLGADATVVDDKGNGAIHHVVSTSQLEEPGITLLQQLLDSGAPVDIQNKEGQTALHLALSAGLRGSTPDKALKIIEMLLAAGAHMEVKDDKGRTPLFQLMESSHIYRAAAKINACEGLVALGAQLDTTDLEGRNLLHCIVKARSEQTQVMRYLVSHGIDPKATDLKGNTLWHLAAPDLAKGGSESDLATELNNLGVDPEKANNDGRSPLHVLVSYHPSAFRQSTIFEGHSGRATNADDKPFFDYFVGLYKNIDCADTNGVSPLHIASTFSEYLTRRLLEEGADPRKPTEEGLTPIHLASRSRQTNTLGILLAWLSSTLNKEVFARALDARDRLGRAALYYACASGRVETVKMLLEAGAAIDSESYNGSPWEGCVALDDESKSQWRWSAAGIYSLDSEPDAAGVMIADTLRTKLALRRTFHSTFPFSFERLDEILELLVAKEPASARRYLDQATFSSIEKQFDHATECLLRVREYLDLDTVIKPDDETLTRLSDRQRGAVIKQRHGESLASCLMVNRQYSLATEEIRRDVESLLSKNELHCNHSTDYGTILHCLVAGGFADMLNKVASPEAVRALQRREGHWHHPLLIDACLSERWNMDVVRLLIEKKGADPNAYRPSAQLYSAYDDRGPTALHFLVRHGHWWQVNVALPYLLTHGADIEAKDDRGVTPLGAALESIKGPQFNREVVETLLKAGADPNATDRQDRTCLSRVVDHREIYQLLTRYGATVTVSAMHGIIRRKDVDLLEVILASGVDPNMRKVGQETPFWESPDGKSFRPARHDPYEDIEHYPLEIVARSDVEDDANLEVSMKMFKLLLDYGADPSARYPTTTAMHRIIMEGTMIERCLDGHSGLLSALLRNPKTDLEATEGRFGRTLLLHACSKAASPDDATRPSMIQLLLDAGANVRARDNDGKTALHILLPSSFRNLDIDCITTAAPELANAVDHQGRTPLHAVFEHGWYNLGYIKYLIKAGSNVLESVTSTGDTALHLMFRKQWTVYPDDEVCIEHRPWVLTREQLWTKPREDAFRLVLGMGGNVNARNVEGETPIFGFFRHASVIVETSNTYPLANDAPWSAGISKNQIRTRTTGEAEHLLWRHFEDVGVDWAAVNAKGQTLLHVAAGVNGISSELLVNRFRFLMEKGLDPMKEDKEHRTPLDIAASLEHEGILALFKTVS